MQQFSNATCRTLSTAGLASVSLVPPGRTRLGLYHAVVRAAVTLRAGGAGCAAVAAVAATATLLRLLSRIRTAVASRARYARASACLRVVAAAARGRWMGVFRAKLG